MKKIISTIQWTLGIASVFVGIIFLFSDFLSGAIACLIGLIFLPPVTKVVKEKYPSYYSVKYRAALICGLIILFILTASSSSKELPKSHNSNPIPMPQLKVVKDVPPPAIAEAQPDKSVFEKELTSLMELSKKAGLVVSYDLSEKGNIVYIDKLWYSQTVMFKKDFLAKIATLKEKVTGFHRFEVRDVYSNEKVAEVTAFSGSLEVYK